MKETLAHIEKLLAELNGRDLVDAGVVRDYLLDLWGMLNTETLLEMQ